MERRNIDRNNVTSGTQTNNQAQRNYNYQQYGRGASGVVSYVENIMSNKVNRLWTQVDNKNYYLYRLDNLGTDVKHFCTQVFNTSHATTRDDNKCFSIIAFADNGEKIYITSTCDDKLIWEYNGTIASYQCHWIGIATPTDPSGVRIYTYDLAPFDGHIPVINENGEIIG